MEIIGHVEANAWGVVLPPTIYCLPRQWRMRIHHEYCLIICNRTRVLAITYAIAGGRRNPSVEDAIRKLGVSPDGKAQQLTGMLIAHGPTEPAPVSLCRWLANNGTRHIVLGAVPNDAGMMRAFATQLNAYSSLAAHPRECAHTPRLL